MIKEPKITRVLMVEDSKELAVVYKGYLLKEGCEVEHVETGKDALEKISSRAFDVMLLDIQLPDFSGMEVLKYVKENNYSLSVVVITGHGSIDIAVDAMKYGAFDFITKPFDASRLKVTLGNAIQHQDLIGVVEHYRETFDREKYCNFIGKSMSMQNVYRIIDSAAPSKATVFITGESGTGKELCAEAIHLKSDRSEKPFVALNCAALPKDLIESEIFGHLKGAFTGASTDREGAASMADGGTMFLDEICEMDLSLQSKLLRFIQTGTIQKIGSNKTEKVNVRFICATNRDPLKEVEAGNFREDLYYRLHVIPIELPPLREREDDVLLIANNFLTEYCEEEGKHSMHFSQQAVQTLLDYNWPGNVRELQNMIRNIVVLNQGNEISAQVLTGITIKSVKTSSIETVNKSNTKQVAIDHSNNQIKQGIRPMADVEREVIEQAIAQCANNIPKAATELGISASKIYRKMQKWNEEDEGV